MAANSIMRRLLFRDSETHWKPEGGLASLEVRTTQPEPSMAELLEMSTPMRALRRGQIVDGHVVRADQDGVMVSIGHKSEGIIPASEVKSLTTRLMNRCQVGAMVRVCVVDPVGSDGQVVLSLDRASDEVAWQELQEHAEASSPMVGKIVGYNRGGAVVNVEGIEGFVPLSQLVTTAGGAGSPEEALAHRVGEELTLKVLEIDRTRNRAIFSERAVARERREDQKEQLLNELQEGETRKGKVTGISSFGAFVDIGGADGLIHISELSWLPVSSVEEEVKVGQEVDVYVLRVDREQRRIALSLRRLTPTPWELASGRFTVGQVVNGTVSKLMDFGAFVRVEECIEGLVHVSELSDRHVRHPREVVAIGDELTLRIVSMDQERHRIGLSLKQVEEYPQASFEGVSDTFSESS